jgi:hypothetical protein
VSEKKISNKQLVDELFPGLLRIPFQDVVKSIGYAKQTGKNNKRDDTLVLPTVQDKPGGKVFVTKLDLILFLDKRDAQRGRPCKVAAAEAA